MLVTLEIIFWTLVLLISPALGYALFVALKGVHSPEGIACNPCGYNRHGLAPDATCPECGAAGIKRNIRHGKTLRSARKIIVRGFALMLIIALATSTYMVREEVKEVDRHFADSIQYEVHWKTRLILFFYPDKALAVPSDGEYSISMSPLGQATASRNHRAMRLFLDLGADPEDGGPFSSPLSLAINRSDTTAAGLLLDAGADPDAATGISSTSNLQDAIEANDVDMVKLLLASGANVNRRGWDFTPLGYAVAVGADLEVFDTLINAGADLNNSGKIFMPPLAVAAVFLRPQIIHFLISRGADPNQALWGDRLLLDALYQMNEKDPGHGLSGMVEILRGYGAQTFAERQSSRLGNDSETDVD